MKSVVAQDVEGSLSTDGTFTGHLRMTLRGDLELLMRTIFRAAPAARWKEVLEEFVKSRGDAVRNFQWKVSDPAALRDPVHDRSSTCRCRALRIGRQEHRRCAAVGRNPQTDSRDGDDKSPVILGAAPLDVSYRLRMKLPAAVTARAPLPVKLTRDYADYRGTYTVADAVVTADRVMTVHLAEIPGRTAAGRRGFPPGRDDGHRAASLAGERDGGDGTRRHAGLTAAQLHSRGYDALQAGNFTEAVALLKRTVELEPKDKVAWNNLGRAYVGLRQTDAAIAAYQKQIEINAYDQYQVQQSRPRLRQ